MGIGIMKSCQDKFGNLLSCNDLMSKIKGAIVDFKKYPTLRTKRYWYFLTMTDISEHLK